MPDPMKLYVCHVPEGVPASIHPCRRAADELRAAGHEFERVVFGKGHPFGLFTEGRRPELKAMSGQEKLPVLKLADGTSVSGSGNIVAWAKENAPAGR
jgi:glutathione S-transferase